jgi:hypothetical protein
MPRTGVSYMPRTGVSYMPRAGVSYSIPKPPSLGPSIPGINIDDTFTLVIGSYWYNYLNRMVIENNWLTSYVVGYLESLFYWLDDFSFTVKTTIPEYTLPLDPFNQSTSRELAMSIDNSCSIKHYYYKNNNLGVITEYRQIIFYLMGTEEILYVDTTCSEILFKGVRNSGNLTLSYSMDGGDSFISRSVSLDNCVTMRLFSDRHAVICEGGFTNLVSQSGIAVIPYTGFFWVIGAAFLPGVSALFHNGFFYSCTAYHISSVSNEPGVGVNWPTYWEV